MLFRSEGIYSPPATASYNLEEIKANTTALKTEEASAKIKRAESDNDKYEKAKIKLAVLDYCLPNMGDIWATIEIDDRKLRDINLLVSSSGDMVDISFSRFGSIWPGSKLSQS